MIISRNCCNADEFAKHHFSEADLGDRRLSKRAAFIARQMARSCGGSIPQVFEDRRDVKAAYEFFDNEAATPDAIQSAHRKQVREQLAQPGQYLLIEDTMEVSFTHRMKVPGLGPLGGGEHPKAQGLLAHHVLAVGVPLGGLADAQARRRPLEVIGLLDQTFYARKPRPRGERKSDSNATKKRDRESQIWEHATDHIGPAPADPALSWTRVCDRGADIYDFLRSCVEAGHHYIVRASYNRALENDDRLLFEYARSLTPLGSYDLVLRGREGKPGRNAHLMISSGPMRLRSPGAPGFDAGRRPAIESRVVRVWEVGVPEGVEPLEWILLTDWPGSTFAEAREVSVAYSSRWLIEELHKGIKTGLGAEELQLETGDRLKAAISVMSVVALRFIDLRESVRLCPDAPAEQSGLDALSLKILSLKTRRNLQTTADVALAVGRLGGHMNRKADGLPGALTLWRGMRRLMLYVECANLLMEDADK